MQPLASAVVLLHFIDRGRQSTIARTAPTLPPTTFLDETRSIRSLKDDIATLLYPFRTSGAVLLSFRNTTESKVPQAGALLLSAIMASLIFAAGFLTYNKVKDKKDKRREQKKKLHEEWYEDLQREHSRGVEEKEKPHSPQKTGGSSNPFEQQSEKTAAERRNSTDSQRSQDGPDKWVDDVNRERRKSLATAG